MSKFIDCERNQAFLLPPDLRDWIPEDDLAHFVIEAVERVEKRLQGQPSWHRLRRSITLLMLALDLLRCQRDLLEPADPRDAPRYRGALRGRHDDHDTIATFRRDNLAAFGESFLQVLLLS